LRFNEECASRGQNNTKMIHGNEKFWWLSYECESSGRWELHRATMRGRLKRHHLNWLVLRWFLSGL
jgi:hypothetical protein